MAGDNLAALRMKYRDKGDFLLEENLARKEPIPLFRVWLAQALAAKEIHEPNAACLATVNSKNIPSNRFVLLKEVTDDGFVFFTNYGSQKAEDIAGNPNVAMTMYWPPLHRSIRIQGIAEKIPAADSESYFRQRPRASQIGAYASAQSSKIPSREYLDVLEEQAREKADALGEVPMPDWGGYLIRPSSVEFWQGQMDRLHDRIVFWRGEGAEKKVDNLLVHMGENGWVYGRLAP